MILDKTGIISALRRDYPTTDQETFITYSGFGLNGVTGAAIKLNVQPASPELTAMSEGEMFKTHKAFTTASGVVESMLVTISGSGEVYRVRGRERFDYGMGQHYELTLVRNDGKP